ncbi:hypothetical protein B0H15DRAFT_1027032 [Mycena belliarum]|uniref:Uncharacterized protein n=1 Tax=Mycena belliarum TaxID=1033014 RepID=A0AAD6XHP1_9AGAR|nr:hypothetical protein B0H15DRAFT_1027032 [Mycena belliae]
MSTVGFSCAHTSGRWTDEGRRSVRHSPLRDDPQRAQVTGARRLRVTRSLVGAQPTRPLLPAPGSPIEQSVSAPSLPLRMTHRPRRGIERRFLEIDAPDVLHVSPASRSRTLPTSNIISPSSFLTSVRPQPPPSSGLISVSSSTSEPFTCPHVPALLHRARSERSRTWRLTQHDGQSARGTRDGRRIRDVDVLVRGVHHPARRSPLPYGRVQFPAAAAARLAPCPSPSTPRVATPSSRFKLQARQAQALLVPSPLHADPAPSRRGHQRLSLASHQAQALSPVHAASLSRSSSSASASPRAPVYRRSLPSGRPRPSSPRLACETSAPCSPPFTSPSPLRARRPTLFRPQAHAATVSSRAPSTHSARQRSLLISTCPCPSSPACLWHRRLCVVSAPPMPALHAHCAPPPRPRPAQSIRAPTIPGHPCPPPLVPRSQHRLRG